LLSVGKGQEGCQDPRAAGLCPRAWPYWTHTYFSMSGNISSEDLRRENSREQSHNTGVQLMWVPCCSLQGALHSFLQEESAVGGLRVSCRFSNKPVCPVSWSVALCLTDQVTSHCLNVVASLFLFFCFFLFFPLSIYTFFFLFISFCLLSLFKVRNFQCYLTPLR